MRLGELILDMSFMQVMREEHDRSDRHRYAWADSSTQSGRDWLLSKSDYIPQEAIVELAEAVRGSARRGVDAQPLGSGDFVVTPEDSPVIQTGKFPPIL